MKAQQLFSYFISISHPEIPDAYIVTRNSIKILEPKSNLGAYMAQTEVSYG